MKPAVDEDARIRLLDLVTCLSDAMDFIDPALVNHHRRVAFIGYSLGLEIGLPQDRLKELIFAGALHDIGAFSLKERKDLLAFEIDDPHEHAERGCALLKLLQPLSNMATIVRFHHLPWSRGYGAEFKSQEVPLDSHILHLADRVAVLIDKELEVLGQVPAIVGRIRDGADDIFMPQLVNAFMDLASKEFFWLDALSPSLHVFSPDKVKEEAIGLTSEDMMGFSRLFSRIIDFKSPFTAAHSSGVAASAEILAGISGFTEEELRLMKIAGYLHDLGKLAVPVEILDKPSGLEQKEFNIIKHHAYYTHRLLGNIPLFDTLNKWASFHHERLDGLGYPFHLKEKDLPEGSQIMAVADVFTAITEDRPYRVGMPEQRAVRVLDQMADTSAISREMVGRLKANYDEINSARMRAQRSAVGDYQGVIRKSEEPAD